MKSILVLVSADPRRGGRAAEGFRVAEGLSLAEDLTVAVLVCGGAAAAFADPADDAGTGTWIDSALLFRSAVVLRGHGVPIHIVGRAGPALEKEMSLLPVSEEEAATLRHGVDVAIEF